MVMPPVPLDMEASARSCEVSPSAVSRMAPPMPYAPNAPSIKPEAGAVADLRAAIHGSGDNCDGLSCLVVCDPAGDVMPSRNGG